MSRAFLPLVLLGCIGLLSSCGGGNTKTTVNTNTVTMSISSLMPPAVSVRSPDTTVIVNGTGFTPTSQVLANGIGLSTTFISATTIKGTLTAKSLQHTGTINIAVADTTSGGATSAPVQFLIQGGRLEVSITGIPSNAPALVTLTGPGVSTSVSNGQAVEDLPTGIYTISAQPVVTTDRVYHPTKPSLSITIADGITSLASIDYSTVVLATTKVLDANARANLTISADGTTLAMDASSPVAQSLRSGDVIVSEPAPAAPDGLLKRILAVSHSNNQIVVTVGPATLADVFESARIDITQRMSPDDTKAATLVPGAYLLRQEQATTETANATVDAPCADSNFVLALEQALIYPDPSPSDPSSPQLTATGKVVFCPGLELTIKKNWAHIPNDVTAVVSFGEEASVAIEGDYPYGSIDLKKTIATVPGKTWVVFVAGIPITVSPSVDFVVGLNGSLGGSLSVGASQRSLSKVGFNWNSNNGLTPISSFQNAFSVDPIEFTPLAFDSTATISAAVHVKIDGVLVPTVTVGPYVQLHTDPLGNPWWSLYAGLRGEVSADLEVLDHTLKSVSTGSIDIFHTDIAHASGPLSPPPQISAVSPANLMAALTQQSLQVSGLRFSSGGKFVLCHGGVCSTPRIVSMNGLSANIQVLLDSAGKWSLQMQNQDSAISNMYSFNVSAAAVGPTVTTYSWNKTPTVGQPFGGNISGTSFINGGTSVFFCITGTNTCYQHPSAGVTVNNANSISISSVNLGISGSWQLFVQTSSGQSGRSSSFSVQAAAVGPTVTGYSWSTTPTAGQPFSGNISGTGFINGGTSVFFCITGTNTCYQHPSAGVTVNNANSISISSVNLGISGSWQVFVQTSSGQSARSASFNVQTVAVVPTVTGFSWSTTPTVGQPFSGTVSGTGFVTGGTDVFFCMVASSTCYQHPSAGVTVNNTNTLSLTNVNLGISGSWQLYVRTSAGSSGRSVSFTIQPAVTLPALTSLAINPSSVASGSSATVSIGLNGTAPSGGAVINLAQNNTAFPVPTMFVIGAGQSSGSFTAQSSTLISSTTTATITATYNNSSRSASITVTVTAPSITGFSWNTTPIAAQPFSGTLSGAGFINGGTSVFFCMTGSSTCYQHPSAGVTVNNGNSLTLTNVNIGVSGSWQMYVQTAAGTSAKSASFTVQGVAPQISSLAPTIIAASTTALTTLTINGVNFSSSGGHLQFTDPGGVVYSSNAHPERVVSVTSTQWVYNINNGSTVGTWQVQVINADGHASNPANFTVR